jgi:hypothetical protein
VANFSANRHLLDVDQSGTAQQLQLSRPLLPGMKQSVF